MVQLMFNIKGRRAVSQQYGKWLKGTNKDKNNRATPEQVVAYKKSRLSNIEIMDMIEMKHHRIRDYFYKGKIAGQIIQFEEANMIHHLAVAFAEQHNIAAITVYDELIVEEEYQPMVQDFMYSTGYCEICDKYSLMNQIKNL